MKTGKTKERKKHNKTIKTINFQMKKKFIIKWEILK